MDLLQSRTPAGVIDDDVDEHPSAACVRRVSQFTELIDAGRALVEFHQRRIDARQVLRSVRRTKSTEARERGRRGIHREQVKDAATERVDDERQFADQVANLSG
jgi:hypothetical protein